MKILSSEQIRQWDAFTIEHEKITSLELMERAVTKCMDWLTSNNYLDRAFTVYCGKGNNGGDGLALARLLSEKNCSVHVFILESGNPGSGDFESNLARLRDTDVTTKFIQSTDEPDRIPAATVVIDALYGTGLNRPLNEPANKLIRHINESGNEILAIDLPSGLYADKTSAGNQVIRATHTLSFQVYKLALLVPENELYFGEVHILDIGLTPAYLDGLKTSFELTGSSLIKAIYKPRKSFAHKGTFGHALVLAGSYGKMGAGVLCCRACLRAGVGLLTAAIPACGYEILQISVPEAMAVPDEEQQCITRSSTGADLSKYNAVGMGPGMGTADVTMEAVEELLTKYTMPVVLDADCLNILAKNQNLLKKLPAFSVLTPHPKEFERLFGKTENDFERIGLAISKAAEYQVIIVLKGHRTLVALPDGRAYFNSTGNAGMATGGSGDVLTGILTGLIAQQYKPADAAILGVYLHGMAGDFAAAARTQESMIASDIVECLGDAFAEIAKG